MAVNLVLCKQGTRDEGFTLSTVVSGITSDWGLGKEREKVDGSPQRREKYPLSNMNF